MLPTKYNSFIDKVYSELEVHGIDVHRLRIDHIGYQADSTRDYNRLSLEMSETASLISESVVGGRRVGIFRFNEPHKYKEETISIIEIVEPKEGQVVSSAWDHVEFLVEETLEEFISGNKDVAWDMSVLDRNEFPMLILNFGNGYRAKFPRMGVLDELSRQELLKQ